MVLRTSHACEYDREDNSKLLFAPRQLALRSPVVLCIWRENSHLCPHLRTLRRRPLAIPNCYWLLLLAGDVERNPGPVKFPCTMCSKPVKRNQRAILCDTCYKWTHASCCGIGSDEYRQLSVCENIDWICQICLLSEMPYANCRSANETSVDLPSQFDTSSITFTEEPAPPSVEHPLFTQHLSFSHLNVQCLPTKLDEILDYLNNIKEPFVLGLSETWLDNSVTDASISPKGYQVYRRDWPNKRGGGIVVYVRDSIRSWRRHDLENDHIEAIWTELHVELRNVPFYYATFINHQALKEV